MAEVSKECVKLIGTELPGSSSVMLSFSVNRSYLKVGQGIKSQDFNILSIAELRFLLILNRNTDIKFAMVMRKHSLAKDLHVELHVVCKALDLNKKVSCLEEWSETMSENIDWTWGGVGIEHLHILVNIISVWADKKTKLYEDEEFTDFKLTTDEGSLPLHKAHLAASSDVFKKMLSGEWKETSDGRLQVEGVSLQTLKHLKQYIYLGTLPDEGLLPLLLIARYYLMDNLKAECLMKISLTVTAENLYEILEYSFLNKIPELMINVIQTMPKYIVKDAYEIMMENEKKCGQADENKDENNCNDE